MAAANRMKSPTFTVTTIELGKVGLQVGAADAEAQLLHDHGNWNSGAPKHRLPRADGRIALHQGMGPPEEPLARAELLAHAAEIKAEGHRTGFAQFTMATGPFTQSDLTRG
jgi:hypothetical protein